MDAVVVGAGPNGLAAAIELARRGRSVVLFEGSQTIGGGMRSDALTLDGFVHDVCSAIHPLAVASPFFRTLDLARHGLDWVHPDAPLAHPLDDGTAVMLERSVDETAAALESDGRAYRRLMSPLVRRSEAIVESFLAPFIRVPRHPLAMLQFALPGVRTMSGLARRFDAERAPAMLAGCAAHVMLPMSAPATAGFGILIGMLGHAVGWPLARGGSQRIADALAAEASALGVEIRTGEWISSLGELPKVRSTLLDVTPKQFRAMSGVAYARRFRYGPGVFKVDWALDGPIPWKGAECLRAGTVHVGGTLGEIGASESAVWGGTHPERPFVILAQQSLFDSTRAPDGKQVVWGYCHVPHGSTVDMTDAIESQIERFAPGFRDRVLARSTRNTAQIESYNPNYVGGDINGGAQDVWQTLARPTVSPRPYATPLNRVYLCSSSTAPGGGVHGMCGMWAARAALRPTR